MDTASMVFVLDNYDSFTYNLVQYLGELGAEVVVRRNDQVTVAEVEAMHPERILLSTVELGDDWTNWRASAPQLVIEPEMDWEGAKLTARASAGG